jgi:hypothetical protein
MTGATVEVTRGRATATLPGQTDYSSDNVPLSAARKDSICSGFHQKESSILKPEGRSEAIAEGRSESRTEIPAAVQDVSEASMMCTNHAQLWGAVATTDEGVTPDADVAVVPRGDEQPE